MKRKLSPEQIAASQARREMFAALAAKLAEMTDDQRQAFADRNGVAVTIEGRALSVRNTCLAAMQTGGRVSMVGGFNQWKRAGRVVRKGERGIKIFAPMKFHVKNGAGEKTDATRAGFGTVTVFDVSQTDVLTETPAAQDEACDDEAQD